MAMDQQAGQDDSDLVGDANHPVLHRFFDDGGTTEVRNDGILYFRARLNGWANSPGTFGANLFIGLEANGDGKLDLFLSASGKSGMNAIYGAGKDLNVSPSTTVLTAFPLWFVQHSNPLSYYAVQTVSDATDDTTPRPLVVDVGGNMTADIFVSFGIPMSVIAQYMQSSAQIALDDNTPLRYALATATQDNAINEDANGLGRNGISSTTPWDTLMNPAVASAVPEPSVLMLAAGVVLTGSSIRPTRRPHRGMRG